MFQEVYNRIARSGITKHPIVRSARRFVSNRLIKQVLAEPRRVLSIINTMRKK